MPQQDNSQLITDLARDLEPVRRIGRVRDGLRIALLLAAIVAAVAIFIRGLHPDLRVVLAEHSGFQAILAGLSLIAVGAVVAAIAASVPGRESLTRISLALGLVGVLIAMGVGSAVLLGESSWVSATCSLSDDLSCLGVSCLVALVPAIAVLSYVARAAPYRKYMTILAASVGSVGIGALVVHLSCPCMDGRHLILAHAAAPFAGGLLLSLPFFAILRRKGLKTH